ncbi:MAG: cytochrome P450 [Phycisphaerales bacterium]|nr:cytochrome P450 [Phycisphaerales bacterium]
MTCPFAHHDASVTLSDDLMCQEVIDDPHSYYRGLREAEPVHWNERWGGWVLTGYDDVVTVLRDREHFSSDRMGFLARELPAEKQADYKPIFDVLSQWMVFRDPPDHTRLRILLNKFFTPKAVEAFRPRVRGIVNDLLDDLAPKGRMDVVRDFAYLTPLTVILELLGAPSLDRDLIKEWSEQIGVFFFIRADMPERRAIACEGVKSMCEYLQPLVEERRRKPQDDLLSVLVQAEKEGGLSEQEVISTAVLLVFGGHETTMNLIANGALALIQHPEAWTQLNHHPDLVPSAVEELLRYDGSVKATVRWAREDVDLGGTTIKGGDRLLVALSAANRDPAQFANPDTLDITRSPNPHVAFAHGIHVCLGAPLARMEGQEAFAALTRRITNPRVAAEELHYFPTVVSRALKELPVEFDT